MIRSAIKRVTGIEVYTEESPLDPTRVRAFITTHRSPDGVESALIRYSEKEIVEYQRLSIAKDMVHIFDAHDERTPPGPKLRMLLEDLGTGGLLPQGLKAIWAEKRAVLGAIELLFPFEARNVLRESGAARSHGHEKIAEFFGVPLPVVDVGMSDPHFEFIQAERRLAGLALIDSASGN